MKRKTYSNLIAVKSLWDFLFEDDSGDVISKEGIGYLEKISSSPPNKGSKCPFCSDEVVCVKCRR